MVMVMLIATGVAPLLGVKVAVPISTLVTLNCCKYAYGMVTVSVVPHEYAMPLEVWFVPKNDCIAGASGPEKETVKALSSPLVLHVTGTVTF
jgi:hypothetical protein